MLQVQGDVMNEKCLKHVKCTFDVLSECERQSFVTAHSYSVQYTMCLILNVVMHIFRSVFKLPYPF